ELFARSGSLFVHHTGSKKHAFGDKSPQETEKATEQRQDVTSDERHAKQPQSPPKLASPVTRLARRSPWRLAVKEDRYHKHRLANHVLHPETLMVGYGYDPLLSEGAVKPPVFLTSTFVFRSAEEGRDFFDYTAGRREPQKGAAAGLVYSRFNHPNSEIVEDRLAAYEGAE